MRKQKIVFSLDRIIIYLKRKRNHMKKISFVLVAVLILTFSEFFRNMGLTSSFGGFGELQICPHKDPNVTELINKNQMGLEYLPEHRTSFCVTKDPIWESTECPGFGQAIEYVLSDWTNENNKRITLHEYGFFSMIHSSFNAIIEAVLKGEKIYFPKLNRWSGKNKKKSFDLWLNSGQNRNLKPREQDYQRISKECGDVNDVDAVNSIVRFGVMSQLMYSLLKPKKFIEDRVKKRKKSFNWDKNDKVIGLYIRRGDSCEASEMERTKRICDDLLHYMDDVKRVSEKYSINKIYLLSDGGTYIYNQTKEYPSYEWMYESTSPHAEGNGRIEDRLRKGDLDGELEATELLVDFFTLVTSDVLVGKMTSNVFRGAVEYKSGELKSIAPYISLDAPWCFCFACFGKVEKGFFKGEDFHC